MDIVLPLGATMHMDGSAMSAIIKVAFLFGIFGIDFNSGKAVLAIAVAVISSVAMSGIPGGGGVGVLGGGVGCSGGGVGVFSGAGVDCSVLGASG